MSKHYDSITVGDEKFFLCENHLRESFKNNQYFCTKEHINKQKEISHAICSLFKYGYNDSSFIPNNSKVSVELKGFKGKVKLFNIDLNTYENLLNSVKIGCNFNILDKECQYGRFQVFIKNKQFYIRVSIHPTINNEVMTFRLIDEEKFDLFNKYNNEISKGLTIIYGKPCSGKTSFAYYLMIQNPQYRIGTIEDPVEFLIDNLIQSEGNYKENIKSLLRHNLDVIFIGEVRCEASAQAVQMSVLSGNNTITTIHSNNIIDIFNRFREYGVNLSELFPTFIKMENLQPKYENF